MYNSSKELFTWLLCSIKYLIPCKRVLQLYQLQDHHDLNNLNLTKQSKIVYHDKSYSFETDFGWLIRLYEKNTV